MRSQDENKSEVMGNDNADSAILSKASRMAYLVVKPGLTGRSLSDISPFKITLLNGIKEALKGSNKKQSEEYASSEERNDILSKRKRSLIRKRFISLCVLVVFSPLYWFFADDILYDFFPTTIFGVFFSLFLLTYTVLVDLLVVTIDRNMPTRFWHYVKYRALKR